MAKKKHTDVSQNNNATIRVRNDRVGNLRTETHRRDSDTLSMAVSTNRNDSTRLFIDTPEGDSYQFDGRAARTIYRLLKKHYRASGKSW
jgi:LPS sulfotransferase NodH